TISCEPPPGLLVTLLDRVGDGGSLEGRGHSGTPSIVLARSPIPLSCRAVRAGAPLPDAGLRGRQLTALRSRSPAANRVPWRLVCCHSSLPSEGRSPLASGVRA